MIPGQLLPAANHLWQSTLFTAAAAMVALVMRNNRASIRYTIWLSASLKFLVPLTLLVSLGNRFPWHAAPAASSAVRPISQVAKQIGEPFGRQAPPMEVIPVEQYGTLMGLLPAIWLCGFLASGASWLLKYRALRAAVGAASEVPLGLPIPVLYSRGRLEPGVVGVWRPVLLLPGNIAERLKRDQLAAVLSHEMCHVRRRDNLTMGLHMLVETIFWFHPLVWWIRERLIEEREQACDEAVVGTGCDPEAYAEGILSVCKFCLDAPPTCMAGVLGADLQKRIEGIMTQGSIRELNWGKRAFVAAAALASLAAPVTIGILHAPRVRAQEAPAAKFEVASVKVHKANDPRDGDLEVQRGGRLVATGYPLSSLIEEAYRGSQGSMRMTGGPAWIRSEEYDIDARPEKGAVPLDLPPAAREKTVRLMLRSLLADRFKLVMRQERRELPVYAVIVAKGGPKLAKAPVEEKDCGPDVPCHEVRGSMGRGVRARASTVADLVAYVETWSDKPIVDRTGLSGLYDIKIDGWLPLTSAGVHIHRDDSNRQTLFVLFEEQLGLKFQQEKAMVDMFVIDHVDRPVDN